MENVRNSRGLALTITVALAAVFGCIFLPAAQGQMQKESQQNAPRGPSMAEYNNFAEADRAKDAAEKVILLDAFVSKYPDSPFLAYVYQSYYEAYEKLKNFQKVMEFAEKRLSSPLNVDINKHFEAAVTWARAYNSVHSDDLALAAKAHEIAQRGLAIIPSLKRPDHMDEKTFASEMREATIYLNATIAAAAMTMKDYKVVKDSLGAVVVLSTYDPAELRSRPTGY
jgi:tetratricopeptide (TPR) repeat protein